MSKIEWTGETWNPITGCTKISQGCKNCYAETMANRLKAMGARGYENGFKLTVQGQDAFDKPLKRKKPTTYFVCSMSDLFQDGVSPATIDCVMNVIEQCPQHTFQILTKRAERMAVYFNEFYGYGAEIPKNVWLGVTVENQEAADERIPHLLSIDASVRFLSCEPLLSEINLYPFLSDELNRCDCCNAYFTYENIQYHCHDCDNIINTDDESNCEICGSCNVRFICPNCENSDYTYKAMQSIHWIIVGGESGHNARPMHPDWARSIRDQCSAAGVPFFFKQWGEWLPNCQIEKKEDELKVFKTSSFIATGDSIGYYKVGKKNAGRLLDGVLHNAMPNV